MKKRKTYSGDFKAKVVLELIRKKKTLTELADQYEPHPNQIKNWKSIFLKQAVNIFDDKRRIGRADKVE
jgi:Transposase.